MVTLVQVFCKAGNSSLRRRIAKDKELEAHKFTVEEYKNNTRSEGWSKISSSVANGTLNVEWDAKTNILSARIVNKGKGKPDKIAGDFVCYLLGRHNKKIKAIHIVSID